MHYGRARKTTKIERWGCLSLRWESAHGELAAAGRGQLAEFKLFDESEIITNSGII